MICPKCAVIMDDTNHTCSSCGFDLTQTAWVVVATVTPPEDALLESLIQSFGYPVRLINSLGSVFGLSMGPLGEVKVAVPEPCADKVKLLLTAELEHPSE